MKHRSLNWSVDAKVVIHICVCVWCFQDIGKHQAGQSEIRRVVRRYVLCGTSIKAQL